MADKDTDTKVYIPKKHSLGRMGDSELSDIARSLAKKFNIPEQEPGHYQGRVFFIEHEPGLLRYEDKVCGFTFQHLPDEDIRQVQYRVLLSYLDAQLDLLRATKTGPGFLICGDLQATRKNIKPGSNVSQIVSNIGLNDFSEAEKFINQHIIYQR
jgi:hypothetical protein